ncbi:MAG: AraC family transcriptional regulator [Bacteroidota bacterium]|nr:AraC family transcriptional regulator [Bacteroidota bacterium]
MKALLEKVSIAGQSAIKVRTYTKYRLDVPYHYHPEFEIVYILEGKGKVMIGNASDDFRKNDLYIIGSSIPHLFVNTYFRNRKLESKTKLLVVQFRKTLVEPLLHIPEFNSLSPFIKKIDLGVKISTGSKLSRQLLRLKNVHAVRRFNALVALIDAVARNPKQQTIAALPRKESHSRPALQRIQTIRAFMLENYHRAISIDELAAHVHLTKTSLCRFMKVNMRSTFSQLLNEVRIEHACSLLEETGDTIQKISLEAGYNNLAYFYRQFQKLKNCSPNSYKKTA